MNTDTPETDAQRRQLKKSKSYPTDPVPADFTRKLERERNAAIEALENHKALAIHTCSQYCQLPLCVANRQLAAMREAIKEAYAAIDLQLFVRGTKDDTTQVRSQMKAALAKLQPFLKP